MMDAARTIADVKREAKTMSRSGDASYQQALDRIAAREGHAHWSAYSAFLDPSTSDDVQSPKVPSENRRITGWRLRQLEQMAGARHSPLDEWTIRRIGRPVATFCEGVGLGEVSGPIIVTNGISMVPLMAMGMLTHAGSLTLGSAILTTIFVAPFGLAANRAPDHEGSRRARRNLMSTFFVWTMVSLCILAGEFLSGRSVATERLATIVAQQLSIWVSIACAVASLCAITWGARDRQRRRSRS
jgi:hypothetical protein